MLPFVEELLAPLDRCAERLLPHLGVAATAEQVEPIPEPVEELLGREEGNPSGCELQRER